MDKTTDSQAQQSSPTIKKKKIKITKKHKRQNEQLIEHEIDTTSTATTAKTSTTSETISTSIANKASEQTIIEHKRANEFVEQIKEMPLDVAPEHIEIVTFEEKAQSIDTEQIPKSIEILPIYHATNIKQVDASENEIQLHSTNVQTQTQICSIKLNECIPLYITDTNQTESTEIRQMHEMPKPNVVSSTFIVNASMVGSEIIPMDNLNSFEIVAQSEQKTAESSCVPFESKMVSESFVNMKEDILLTDQMQMAKIANESYDTQHQINVENINVCESIVNLNDIYEPKIVSAECEIMSSASLNVQETISQNTPIKFYPETFIAIEEASPKYVEQSPYQTEIVCTVEAEDSLNVNKIPDVKQANVDFSKRQAYSVEQIDTKDSEIPSDYSIPLSLRAIAKDSLTFHTELHSNVSQALDTSAPTQPLEYKMQNAVLSIEDFESNVTESINVFQSEESFDIKQSSIKQEANIELSMHETLSVTEIQANEHDIDLVIEPTHFVKANKSEEPHKINDSSYELLFDTIDVYEKKSKDELVRKAQIDFELQKSTIDEITLTHESEQTFDKKPEGHTPKYIIDTTVNSPIVIHDAYIEESDTKFIEKPLVSAKAQKMHEPYHTFDSNNEQLFDTTDEYFVQSRAQQTKAHLTMESQKSMITEIMQAHESESAFQTKSHVILPLYTLNLDANNSINVSEAEINVSENALEPFEKNEKYLLISETPQSLMRLGTVSETIPCDSTEFLESNLDKGVKANYKSEVVHEISIDMHNIAESLDQLIEGSKTQGKIAIPNINLLNALQVSIDNATDTYDETESKIQAERFAKINKNVPTTHSIEINEVKPLESSTEMHDQKMPTESFASVIPNSYNEANTSEVWPLENTQNFYETPVITDHITKQNFIEKTALQISNEMASDALNDFTPAVVKEVDSKCSIVEMKGLTQETVLVHEQTESSSIQSFDSMFIKTASKMDIDVQHRCEQFESNTFETSVKLETPTIQKLTSTSELAEMLTLPNISEIQVNQSEGIVEDFASERRHANYNQEAFNVIGQSIEHIMLDSECELRTEPNERMKQPNMKVVEMISYNTNVENILEKENQNIEQSFVETGETKETQSHFFGVADVMENTTLFGVRPELITVANRRYAENKYESCLESIVSGETVAQEMVKFDQNPKMQSHTATETFDHNKMISVESIEILEKEKPFVEPKIIGKQCDQTIENYLRAPITEMLQPLEHTKPQPIVKNELNVTANQISEQIDQNITYETVSLVDESISERFAKQTTDKTVNAIEMMEQYPLQKETILQEKKTNKLLTKTDTKTQESELCNVNREFVKILKDERDQTITNIKMKKTIETKGIKTGEIKGRWTIILATNI